MVRDATARGSEALHPKSAIAISASQADRNELVPPG